MTQPATVYEVWVRTLRAWATDESVSLATLPQLAEDSMPMAAYTRLIDHINAALETVTNRWDEALAKVLASMSDPRDLGQELVALRRKLARRLELARHPALPQVLRNTYSQAADKDVRTYQQQLEDAIMKLSRSGRVPTPVVDELYRAMRENSFVAVLGYAADTKGGQFTANHQLTVPHPGGGGPPDRPRGRRVIV